MPNGTHSDPPAQGAPSIPAQTTRDFLTQERSGPHELPRVVVPGGNVSVTTSAELLFRAIAESRRIFYRGSAVVES